MIYIYIYIYLLYIYIYIYIIGHGNTSHLRFAGLFVPWTIFIPTPDVTLFVPWINSLEATIFVKWSGERLVHETSTKSRVELFRVRVVHVTNNLPPSTLSITGNLTKSCYLLISHRPTRWLDRSSKLSNMNAISFDRVLIVWCCWLIYSVINFIFSSISVWTENWCKHKCGSVPISYPFLFANVFAPSAFNTK